MWRRDVGVRSSRVSACEGVNEEHDMGLKVQDLGMLGFEVGRAPLGISHSKILRYQTGKQYVELTLPEILVPVADQVPAGD